MVTFDLDIKQVKVNPVIIWTNYDGPKSPILHTNFQGNLLTDSREDFWRVFIIYGHGGHLGHVTWTIWTNFSFPISGKLLMKFDFNWPSGSRGEDVWKCSQTTDDTIFWFVTTTFYFFNTLVNQKALVVAATLQSRLFNALEWAKNGRKGKQKIYLFLL